MRVRFQSFAYIFNNYIVCANESINGAFAFLFI